MSGLGLAMIGLHGIVSYAVSARLREIAIRRAVGAAVVLSATALASWFPARRATRVGPSTVLKAE